uniref:Uncharacterized protein n=1 Tax=Amphimedon queenslandica TaxID=400682 RepID=A0A1X7UWL2_AMPQE
SVIIIRSMISLTELTVTGTVYCSLVRFSLPFIEVMQATCSTHCMMTEDAI